MTYKIKWTEDAAKVRDTLPDQRRSGMEHALKILQENPYIHPSHELFANRNRRSVRLTQYIILEYIILEDEIVLVILQMFDELPFLIQE